MRRPLAWLLAALALLALLKRRRAASMPPPAMEAESPDPHAEELRRRLAESRGLVEERETFESAEPTVDQTEHAPDDPGRRRQAVHEAGRQVAREMRETAG